MKHFNHYYFGQCGSTIIYQIVFEGVGLDVLPLRVINYLEKINTHSKTEFRLMDCHAVKELLGKGNISIFEVSIEEFNNSFPNENPKLKSETKSNFYNIH